MRKRKFKKYLIGEKFKNNKNLEYKIIDYTEMSTKRKIRFIKTGYETIVGVSSILNGEITDYLEPSVFDVGYAGERNATKHILYHRWYAMLSRCYNKNNDGFENYGSKGVYVDESWHDFRNFVKDIEKKENYDKLIEDSANWHIDKDLSGKNYYSNETTQIISRSENNEEMLNRTKHQRTKRIDMYDLYGNFIKTYNSINECANELGVTPCNITDCLHGRQKTSKGYVFYFSDNTKNNKSEVNNYER